MVRPNWFRSLKLVIGSLTAERPVKRRRRPEHLSSPVLIQVLESRRLLSGNPVHVLTVDTLSDTPQTGHTTLRQAISTADSDSPGDTIMFASGLTGVITLTKGDLVITNSMTITGPGAGTMTISGNNQSRIFTIDNPVGSNPVTIVGLTLDAGNGSSTNNNGYGGAIALLSNTGITLANDTLLSNSALDDGGAIYNGGSMILTNDTISLDFAEYGSGVFNSGILTSSGTTFSNNIGEDGGGIYNTGTLNSSTDTFSYNSTGEYGGGIYNQGSLTAAKDAFTGNVASVFGGGIYNYSGATLTSSDDTFEANSTIATSAGSVSENAGGGVANVGTLMSTNDTFASNTSWYGAGIYNSGQLTTTNDTIAGNTATYQGGGVDDEGSWNSLNTIVVGNTFGGTATDIFKDVQGVPAINAIDTLIGTANPSTGITNGINGNIVGAASNAVFVSDGSGNPLLTNNGGTTTTIALIAGSPAIGAGGSLTTLSVAITATATTLTVTAPTFLAVGDFLRIGTEIMQVTAVTGDTATVLRGQAGSTAAAQAANAAIYLAFDQRDVIRANPTDIGAYQTPVPILSMLNGTATYSKGSAPIAISPNLVLSDSRTESIASATVTITGWNSSEDRLSFLNSARLATTFTTTTTTATLTLTGVASLSAYQAELRSLTYQDVQENVPVLTARNVIIAVTDSAANTANATTSITVQNVNLPPVVTSIETTSLAYAANTAPVAITATALANDPDSATLSKMTIQLTSGYQNGQDLLSFTNQYGVTGSFNATTGMLTLIGNVAPGYYRLALRSVLFSSAGTAANRTLSIIAYDNQNLASSTVTRTVAVIAGTITGPLISGLTDTVVFGIGGGPVLIAPNLVLTDFINRTVSSATVTITNWNTRNNGEDVLNFYNSAALNHTFTVTNNVATLTLTGSKSLAAYQADLQSLTFQDLKVNGPVITPRTFTISFTDSAATTLITPSVSINLQNSPPVVKLGATTLAYTANTAFVAVAPAATVTDPSTGALSKMTIQITSGYQVNTTGQDTLNFVNQNGITGSFNKTTGMLTLMGNASLASYQLALRSITFGATGTSVSMATRILSVIAYDQSTQPVSNAPVTLTVTVAAGAYVPLSVTGLSATQTFAPGSSALAFAPNLVLADNVGLTLTQAVITITNWNTKNNGEDALNFYNSGALNHTFTVTNNVATLTLTGNASLAAYQGDLRSMTYQDLKANGPVADTKQVKITITDITGATASINSTITVL